IIVGVSLAIPATWLEQVVAERFPATPKDTEALEKLLSTPAKRWILIASLTFIMPVCDDLLFRGALFTLLKRSGRVDTVVFATATFNLLVTLDPRTFPSLFAMLLAIGWIRAMTGSVIPSIAARVVFFFILYAPSALRRDGPPTTKPILAAS